MHAPAWRYCIPFPNARTKSEGGERSWTKCGKIMDAGRTNSYILLRGCWTESYQNYTQSTEMIADLPAKIKIVMFHSILDR